MNRISFWMLICLVGCSASVDASLLSKVTEWRMAGEWDRGSVLIRDGRIHDSQGGIFATYEFVDADTMLLDVKVREPRYLARNFRGILSYLYRQKGASELLLDVVFADDGEGTKSLELRSPAKGEAVLVFRRYDEKKLAAKQARLEREAAEKARDYGGDLLSDIEFSEAAQPQGKSSSARRTQTGNVNDLLDKYESLLAQPQKQRPEPQQEPEPEYSALDNYIATRSADTAQPQFRNWVSRDRTATVDAVFLREQGGIVYLRTRTGREIKTSREYLSPADIKYLDSLK